MTDTSAAGAMGPAITLTDKTFDSFVVGPSNQFAVQKARQMAEGKTSPLILMSSTYGMGKTHLLHATESLASMLGRKVAYRSIPNVIMESDKNSIIEALYATDNLVLLDNVEGLLPDHGLERVRTAIIHRIEAHRPLMCAADLGSEGAAQDVPEPLRSHLRSGLSFEVEPADYQLRMDILQLRMETHMRVKGLLSPLQPTVLNFVAEYFHSNIRDLDGALTTLIERAGKDLAHLTIEEAKYYLRVTMGARRPVTVDEIQKAIAEHYGLRQSDLLSEVRTRMIARPRQAAMWLSKQLTTRSMPDIGRRFGNRDHTTVLHAVRRIDELREIDPVLKRELDTLKRKLRP